MILAYFAIGVVTTLVLGAVVRAVRSDRRHIAQLSNGYEPQVTYLIDEVALAYAATRPQRTARVVDVEVVDLPKTLGR